MNSDPLRRTDHVAAAITFISVVSGRFMDSCWHHYKHIVASRTTLCGLSTCDICSRIKHDCHLWQQTALLVILRHLLILPSVFEKQPQHWMMPNFSIINTTFQCSQLGTDLGTTDLSMQPARRRSRKHRPINAANQAQIQESQRNILLAVDVGPVSQDWQLAEGFGRKCYS